MPIVRLCNAKLLYYAHVPKCAGTAVESHLRARFGPLGMFDPPYGRRSALEAWSLSPPQHMPEAVRLDLLPDTLFDALFSTVRHPLLRLRSVFLFHREIENALPKKMRFPHWLNGLPRVLASDPYALHGHVRPMAEMVPHNAHVFRIEDGLTPLVNWLDERSGEKEGPRKIAKENVLEVRIQNVPQIALTREVREMVAQIYAVDYERFDYPLNPEDLPSKIEDATVPIDNADKVNSQD